MPVRTPTRLRRVNERRRPPGAPGPLRQLLESVAPRTERIETYPAATGGLSDDPYEVGRDTACRLENFIPYPTGVRPRPGLAKRLNPPPELGDHIDTSSMLVPYENGVARWMFVWKDERLHIYEIESDGGYRIRNYGAGLDMSDAMVGTTFKGDAGVHCFLVDGTNHLRLYEGNFSGSGLPITTLPEITGSSNPAITNVQTNLLEHVWIYNNRVWFVQKDSVTAWYLPTLNITGAATRFPLFGVFPKYSPLLFGSNWSVSTGAGLQNLCVFVTESGDCAVYSGDPSGDFSLVGVYSIPQPLGKSCHFEYGGDLLIGTTEGLTSMQRVVFGEPNAPKHISEAIERTWRTRTIGLPPSNHWRATKWNSRELAFIYNVEFSADPFVIGLNLTTGAWFEIPGRRVSAMAELDDRMFVLGDDGALFEFAGGKDGEDPVRCLMRLTPHKLGTNVDAARMRTFWRGEYYGDRKSIATVPHDPLPDYPAAVATTRFSSEWGTAMWNMALWQDASPVDQSNTFDGAWEDIDTGEHRFSLNIIAPTVQATFQSDDEITAELNIVDVSFGVVERPETKAQE